MSKWFTNPANRRYGAALWAGFWGGNISSFVKWGSENPFPPRTPDRGIPPLEMLKDMGFNAADMTYHFSEKVINWGVAGVHHLFSIFFALLYSVIAEIFPGIKLWQGLAFGLVVTIVFHAILLPMFHWGPPLSQLPGNEIFSELFGHAAWMWTIEIFRRDIRNRITGQPDAEFMKG
ncbi:MAG: DUF1440 domain-containing protein [Lautropia sp.]|nr:DUF1440 domain-containing protein [Lautropia sp.]